MHILKDFDRVIVLENGKIVEDGDPRELAKDAESKFYTLLTASNTIKGPGII